MIDRPLHCRSGMNQAYASKRDCLRGLCLVASYDMAATLLSPRHPRPPDGGRPPVSGLSTPTSRLSQPRRTLGSKALKTLWSVAPTHRNAPAYYGRGLSCPQKPSSIAEEGVAQKDERKACHG